MTDFSNKIIVVTGSSSGIGLEIGLAALETGAKVIFCSRNIEKNIPKILSDKKNLYVRNLDVADESSVENFFGYIEKEFGYVSILVNNAGFVNPMGLLDTTLENWNTTININLTGTFLCTKFAVRLMKTKGGKIINISSTAALTPRPGWSAYAAAKSGIISFSAAMSEELKEYDIKVFVFCPGRTATPLRKILAPEEDPSTIMQPDTVSRIIKMSFYNDFDVLEGQPIFIRERF
ncbi:MAG: SDR family oxidoreductase [Chitinophagaceae bacterium]|nr:SDR family oxidoreductase [Chitinophagaceae bacterium]